MNPIVLFGCWVKSIDANCVIWDAFGDQDYNHMNALLKGET